MDNSQNFYNAPAADLAPDMARADYQPRALTAAGRIGRLRYLAYGFGASGAIFFAFMVCGITLMLKKIIPDATGPGLMAMLCVAAMAWLAAAMVLAKRRLNDLGMSGWWCLIVLVPAVDLLALVLLALWPGDAARNAYGAPPSANPRTLWLSFLLPPLLVLTVKFFQSYDTRTRPPAAAVKAGRSP